MVNKAAFIARLKQLRNWQTDAYGILPVTQGEVDDVANEITRYRADSLINTSED